MQTLIKLLLGAILVVLLLYVAAYVYHAGKVKVICKDRKIYDFLEGKVDKLYYFPNWKYGISGELSSLKALRLNKTKYRPRRELMESPDGGEFAIDWFESQNGKVLPDDAPILVFQHGMSGGSSEPCIQKFALRCVNELGWRSCCFILRGCCGLRAKTMASYHGTYTFDLHQGLKHVSSLYPDAPIALVGYSLGGNMIAQYFGERESKYQDFVKYDYYLNNEKIPSNIICGSAVCCPFNFLIIDKTISDRYQRIVGSGTWHWLENNKKVVENTEYWKNLPKDFIPFARNIDKQFTIHFYGFKDTDEFYDKTSCYHVLNGIKLPFLFISTKNDIFSISKAFPAKILKEECGDNVGALMLPSGGHNGMFYFNNTKNTFDEDILIKYYYYYFNKFKEERKNKKKEEREGEKEEGEKREREEKKEKEE